VKNALVCLLTGAGFLALLFGLSYAWIGTPSETTSQIGFPDPWFVHVKTANGGFTTSISLWRWSFGALVIGVLAIVAAIRLGRRPAKSVETN
jgi:hypothetical protein